MASKTLHNARLAKEDEFYTQIADIERELRYYKQHFKDKVIFCNCDDPETSNFWKYFELLFEDLGIKKLVSTHFDAEKPTYKLELMKDVNRDGKITDKDIIKTPLQQNGDFRSPECIEILKEADIIITNPPFSLFREYVAQLIEYDKKFLIIGNQNAVAYKEIFPLIKDNKIWLGYYSGNMEFKVPEYYEERVSRYWVDETGQKWRSMGNICWYSNLDIAKRHDNLILYKQFNDNDYPHYENYEGIDVGAVKDIPVDYYGVMGVPITFLNVYNPAQFEIVGLGSGYLGQSIGIKGIDPEHKKMMREHSAAGDLYFIKNGVPKVPYTRILIRRKQQ